MKRVLDPSYNHQLPTSAGLQPRTSPAKRLLRWLWRVRLVRLLVFSYTIVSLVVATSHLLQIAFDFKSSRALKNLRIGRPYDTHGVSPLSEMDHRTRFFKMHSKMPRLFTDSVRPFYIKAELTPESDDVTVSAFVTRNRISDLKLLVEKWQGPISATYHIPSRTTNGQDPTVLQALRELQDEFSANELLRRHVDVHLITGPISINQPELLPRPTNFHLNLARFFARTEFILYLDHDTWPSPGARDAIRRQKDLMLQHDVLVLPTFIFTENATVSTRQLPKTRSEVVSLVERGEMGLQDDGWELNRGPTCLPSWLKDKVYNVDEYELHYRPNFVSRRGGNVPWCTERFDDNKAACLYQMYITGSEIWVLPDAFTVRFHYNPDSHLLKPNESKWTKAINSRLYTKYYREACVHYARQFIFLNQWDSPRTQHLKEECNRVLTNWGGGFVDT